MSGFALQIDAHGVPSVLGGARTAEAGVTVLFDGYLTDARQLAERLGDPLLAAAPPERVVARAYARLGSRFAAALTGAFAYAVVDGRTRRVIAGRDPIGVGRLLVCHRGDAVILATGPTWVAAAHRALTGQDLALDLDGLRGFIATGGVLPGESTVYAGVRHVPPGHVLVADAAGVGPPSVRTARIWQPHEAPGGRATPITAAALDEEVRALLADAVLAGLPTDVPAWVDVSGGLDSAVVAAVAADQARVHGLPEPVAFSVVHGANPDADESAYQDVVVRHLRLRHVRFDVDRHVDFEEPDLGYLAYPTNGMMQGARIRATRALMVENRVGVRIAGLGGDQVFCGDDFPPVHLGAYARTGQWGLLAGELGGWLSRGDRSLYQLVRTCVGSPLTARASGPGAVPGWASPSVARWFADHRRSDHDQPRLFDDPAREVQWREVVALASVLDPCDAPWTSRFPLLHLPLVERMLCAPWSHKLGPGGDRVVQRRAFRGLVPDVVLDRRGKGDGTPRMLRGLRTNWARARRWAAGERLAALGLVDPTAFRQGCERLRHGLLGDDLPFYVAALSLEIWLEAREGCVDHRERDDAPLASLGGCR